MTKQNNTWLFGNGLSLDFNHTPPKTGRGLVYTFEGSATFSDPETGEILLSTDGMKLWDGQGNEVPGMISKGHSSSTSAGIIVPMPGSPGRFYMLSAGEVSGAYGFWNPDGSINMNANVSNTPDAGGATGIHVSAVEVDTDGSVRVLSSGEPLVDFDPEAVTEKLCIVAKDNCRDFWLITGLREELMVYSIDPEGIRRVGTYAPSFPVSPTGYIRASPDGRSLAVASVRVEKEAIDVDVLDSLVLYDFDTATGAITKGRALTKPGQHSHSFGPYGLEFSPNSRRLYYSLAHHSKPYIFQVDLDNDLAATKLAELPPLNVGKLPHTRYGAAALLRGPDGLVYATRPGSRFLAAITEPDLPGHDCGFEAKHIAFGEGEVMFFGLPTLVEFRGCDPQPLTEPSTPGGSGGCKPCVTEHCVTVSWSAGTRACITISTVECDPCRGRPTMDVNPCPCGDE